MRLPDGYSCSSNADYAFCAYSAHLNPVILMNLNQSATTASSKLADVVFARLQRAANISPVIGLCCLAMSSSFSLARMILAHILVQSDKLAEAGRFRSRNKVFTDLAYP
jgi:hypothetical protein